MAIVKVFVQATDADADTDGDSMDICPGSLKSGIEAENLRLSISAVSGLLICMI